jgi:broad specificity phosphatase PhoE
VTPIFLVRHAYAGHSAAWVGDDAKRPLDETGRRQAEALVGQLEGRDVSRIFSSPALRCAQTVEPLALARRLPIEHREELAEGASREDVLALLRKAGKGDAVLLCTHGDVVEAVLGHESEKGSTWVLERRGDELEPVEYLAPPA